MLVACCNSTEFAACNNAARNNLQQISSLAPICLWSGQIKGLPVNNALAAPQLSLIDFHRYDSIIVATFIY